MNSTQTVLEVSGMSCQSCVRHVTADLRKLDGVSTVEVQLEQGKVRVEHDPSRAPVDALVAAIRKAGYETPG